ncbi:MAG: thioesterase domain-containing protein, partial [Thermomicrobiales bacterium]
AEAARYVAQMRPIQGAGPYLLYGICVGGYYAWEAARQLLAAGEEVAGMLFYEVPIRSSFADGERRGLARYYRPEPLPVDLTLLMTGEWQTRGWSAAWRKLALGTVETVVVPGETKAAFDRREERIARHVRDWIEQAEARVRAG